MKDKNKPKTHTPTLQLYREGPPPASTPAHAGEERERGQTALLAEMKSYEEQRSRQMEENKRKLDELRLHNLSAAVRQAAAKPMPTKIVIPRNPRVDAPIRRSGRISNLPEQPDYRPAKAQRYERAELPNPVPVYATNEERAYAVTKAEELKDQLGSDYSTFIKPMSHSYATKSGHLDISIHFSQYLPVHDEMVTLVDEVNKEFDMFYHIYGHRYRLTGWKAFSADHKLVDGDCLVFQLIERRKFKVYVVRASSYNQNDH